MGLSERRACSCLKSLDPGSAMSTKEATDEPPSQKMKELVLQYPRYGCRRICIFWRARVTR